MMSKFASSSSSPSTYTRTPASPEDMQVLQKLAKTWAHQEFENVTFHEGNEAWASLTFIIPVSEEEDGASAYEAWMADTLLIPKQILDCLSHPFYWNEITRQVQIRVKIGKGEFDSYMRQLQQGTVFTIGFKPTVFNFTDKNTGKLLQGVSFRLTRLHPTVLY